MTFPDIDINSTVRSRKLAVGRDFKRKNQLPVNDKTYKWFDPFLNASLSSSQMIAEGVMTKEEVSSVINDHTAYLNKQARSLKMLLSSAEFDLAVGIHSGFLHCFPSHHSVYFVKCFWDVPIG